MFPVPSHALAHEQSGLTNGPTGLVEHVAAVFWSNQQQLARQMRTIAELHDRAGAERAEFVGDDLAAAFRLHPATGTDLVIKAVKAVRLVGLIEAMEALEITDRHVHAVTGELSRWQLEPELAQQVVTRVLTRTREWVAAGRGTRSWPTPGELKRKIRAAVLLHDAQAAKKARDKAAHDRGADLYQSGVGEATLTITGPEAQLLRMWAALEARAQALGELPGDERTQEQRLFDAAEELLCADAQQPATGGLSPVPGHTESGTRMPVWVRGVQLQLVVPYSVSQGHDLEVCEVPGYGPVLPATARELMAGTTSVQRIAVRGDTGELIGLDDRTPLRPTSPTPATEEPQLPLDLASTPDPAVGQQPTAHDHKPAGTEAPAPTPDVPQPDGPAPDVPAPDSPEPDSPEPDDPEPDVPEPDVPEPDLPAQPDADAETEPLSPIQAARRRLEQLPPLPEPPPPPALADPVIPPSVLDAIRRIITAPLPTAPPAEDRYRPSGRLARHVNARDQTCTFPGCTRPAVRCDRDHRIPYPQGPTSTDNIHCLCRHHHRAKQVYFTVTTDQTTGETIWRTPDGREYRRPPPDH